MKDEFDNSTPDLIETYKKTTSARRKKTVAKNQKTYREKKKAQGFKEVTIWIKEDIYNIGKNKGLSSSKNLPEEAQSDPVAWSIGFAHGCQEKAIK